MTSSSRARGVSVAFLLTAACAASTGDAGGGAGSSSGDGRGGGGGAGDAASGTHGASTTSSSASSCTFDVSTKPWCNGCILRHCCEEAASCYEDPREDCFDEDGGLDPGHPGAAALHACMARECETPCSGTVSAICDSGFSHQDADGFPDDPRNVCLSEACCDEFKECTADATDIEACAACLEGEGADAPCERARACEEASGC